MTFIAKEDFLWYKKGDGLKEKDKINGTLPVNWIPHFEDTGVDSEMDLNKDGKVDAKDRKIAGKTLARGRWKKK